MYSLIFLSSVDSYLLFLFFSVWLHVGVHVYDCSSQFDLIGVHTNTYIPNHTDLWTCVVAVRF